MINNLNNIIFDLDGTIADTSADIRDSLKKAFIRLDLFTNEIDKKVSSALIGPPLKEMIIGFNLDIDNSVIDDIIIMFRKIYMESGFPNTMLFNGIQAVFEFLYIIKKQIFIATNKPEAPTLKILGKLNIIERFSGIVCVDTYYKPLSKNEMLEEIIHRWNLNPNETIMIGDSASDIIAAKMNKIHSIGILSGYGDADDILIQQPDFYINNHVELINILQA